jgi:hypothetical protein
MLRKTLQASCTGSDFKHWMLFVDVDGSVIVYRDGSSYLRLSAADFMEIYRSESSGSSRMIKLLATVQHHPTRRIDATASAHFVSCAAWLDHRFDA